MNAGDMGPVRFPFEEPPEEGCCREVADGVLWFRLPLPSALNHVNVYALRDEGGWTIIDTGIMSKRSIGIWEAILRGPLGGDPVNVLVTHHHPDHVGVAGWFQSNHGSRLTATRTTWLYARMLTLDVQETWPAETLAFYRASGMPRELIERRMLSRPFNFADTVHPLPLGFERIRDGDVLRIGGRRWRVIVGNGHSPEHATLWSEDDHLVIAGDQVLPGITPNLGVYPTEPDADPVAEWLTSCKDLSRHAREDHLVLPGHKLPFVGLPARLEELIEHHLLTLDALHEHLGTPSTAHDCLAPMYGRKIREGEYGLAIAEAVGHLNHLFQTGRIERRQRVSDGALIWERRD